MISNKKHLDIHNFYKCYKDEIDHLFDLTLSSLLSNDIRIFNVHNFYSDFVHYIYKYNITINEKIFQFF